MRERVHEARDGEHARHVECERDVVDDRVGSHLRIVAGALVVFGGDAVDVGQLRARVGRRDRDEAHVVVEPERLAKACRGATAERDDRVGAACDEALARSIEDRLGHVAASASEDFDRSVGDEHAHLIDEAGAVARQYEHGRGAELGEDLGQRGERREPLRNRRV